MSHYSIVLYNIILFNYNIHLVLILKLFRGRWRLLCLYDGCCSSNCGVYCTTLLWLL